MTEGINLVDGWLQEGSDSLLQWLHDWADWGWSECFECAVMFEIVSAIAMGIMSQAVIAWLGSLVSVLVLIPMFIASHWFGRKVVCGSSPLMRVGVAGWTTANLVAFFVVLVFKPDRVTTIDALNIAATAVFVLILYLTREPKDPGGPPGGKRRKLIDFIKESGPLPQLEGSRT